MITPNSHVAFCQPNISFDIPFSIVRNLFSILNLSINLNCLATFQYFLYLPIFLCVPIPPHFQFPCHSEEKKNMSTLCVLYTFLSEKNKAFHQHSVHKYSEISMKFKTGLLENVNDGGNLKAKKF